MSVQEQAAVAQAAPAADHASGPASPLLWSMDGEGTLSHAADWSSFTGLEGNQLREWRWLHAVHADDRAALRDCWNRSPASNSPHDMTFHLRRHDGIFRTMRGRAVPLTVPSGGVGWFISAVDVTEQLEAALVMRIETDRARLLFDTTTQGVVFQDATGRITGANPAAQRLLGMTLDQMQGRQSVDPRWRAVHADGSDFPGQTHPAMVALATGQDVRDVVMGVFHPGDEAYCWLRVMAIPVIPPGAAKPLEVYCIFEDITEHKAAEEQLAWSEERYRTIVDGSPNGIMLVDKNGTIVLANHQVTMLLGYDDMRELVDTGGGFSYVTAEDRPRAEQALGTAIATGQGSTQQYAVRKRDGTTILVEATIQRIVGAQRGDGSRFDGALVIATDVTERVRATEQAAHLAAIVDSSSDAIIGKTLDGTILSWNKGAEFIYGYSAAEVIGRSIALLVSPDRPDELPRLLEAIGSGQRESHYDTVRRHKDGRLINVSLALSPILDVHGRIIGASSTARDITEAKQAQQALRESEERFARAFVVSPAAMVISRLGDGMIVDANESYLQFLGYRREQMIGHTSADLHLLAELADRRAIIDLLQMQGTVRDHGLVMITSSGERRDVLISSVEIAHGGAPCMLTIVTDITERKQVEAQLGKLSRVVEQTADVVVITDRNGVIEYVNPAFTALTGYLPEEALGQTPRLLRSGRQDAAFYATMWRTITRGESFRGNFTNRKKNGELYYEDKAVGPLADETGRVTHFVATGRDVTERMLAEEALRRAHEELETRVTTRTVELAAANASLVTARDEAQTANQAKSLFLSRMSHELRTPMNAVLGFAQILTMGDLLPEDEERVQLILKAGRHLLQLIDEILDIARIEAGHLTLSLETVDLTHVTRDVLNLTRSLAAARRITIVDEVAQGVEHAAPVVLADQQRLFQVLLNLVSNAIKYNREGGQIIVSCQVQADGRLRLAVRDTGVGLYPEDLARLFIPFERLHAANSGVEGTGIGLVLAKQLAELMGGVIGVESTPGEGSLFWVTLPQAEWLAGLPAHLADATVPMQLAAGRHTILYIEDNLSNVLLVEHILAKLSGARLLTAIQGSLGLDLAREHQPDLILLDLHLPDMSGEEVLRRLKADPATHPIPVVVLSADAVSSTIARLRGAGALAYLTKPLDVGAFLQLVRAVLAGEAVQQVGTDTGPGGLGNET